MTTPLVVQLLGPSQGGIGRHVGNLAACLSDWEVTVAGPSSAAHLLGPTVRFLPVDVRLHPAAIVRSLRPLRKLVAGADLVHAHGLTAAWLAWMAGAGGRPPLVVTLHNVVLPETRGRAAPPLRLLGTVVPRVADAVICVTDEIAARLGHSREGRVRVIRPGITRPQPTRTGPETRRALCLDDDDEVVVVPARLHPQKALPVMVAAAALLAAERPRLRVLIVGTGPDEESVRASVREHGAEGTVRLLGFRDDLPDLLLAADVVALSSAWEGAPLAVGEAMALGRPVVATAVGGMAEVVVDGHTGRLVPPRDPAALAGALAEALDDPVRAAAWGEAGRRKAEEEFSMRATADAVEAVYRDVLR
ncbi:MAG: glycosyltransferase family 4 protein [Actinomycetota bacterium]